MAGADAPKIGAGEKVALVLGAGGARGLAQIGVLAALEARGLNVVAIAGEIEDKMLEAGARTLRREGRAEGRWILLDFGDVVVHVFHDEDRQYYSLERLWSDCPAIPLDVVSASSAEAASAPASSEA